MPDARQHRVRQPATRSRASWTQGWQFRVSYPGGKLAQRRRRAWSRCRRSTWAGAALGKDDPPADDAQQPADPARAVRRRPAPTTAARSTASPGPSCSSTGTAGRTAIPGTRGGKLPKTPEALRRRRSRPPPTARTGELNPPRRAGRAAQLTPEELHGRRRDAALRVRPAGRRRDRRLRATRAAGGSRSRRPAARRADGDQRPRRDRAVRHAAPCEPGDHVVAEAKPGVVGDRRQPGHLLHGGEAGMQALKQKSIADVVQSDGSPRRAAHLRRRARRPRPDRARAACRGRSTATSPSVAVGGHRRDRHGDPASVGDGRRAATCRATASSPSAAAQHHVRLRA